MGIPSSVDESPRYLILQALASSGPSNTAELTEATGLTNRQVLDNARAAVKEGLAARDLDDDAKTVLYSITQAGRRRLTAKTAQDMPETEAPLRHIYDAAADDTDTAPVRRILEDAALDTYAVPADDTDTVLVRLQRMHEDAVLVRLQRMHEDAVLARDRYVLTMTDPVLDALTGLVDQAERALQAYSARVATVRGGAR